MKIAILALQGDFAEHEAGFRSLGCDTFQIRQKKDLEQSFSALILPGGESTVQGKLLRDSEMFEPLRQKIINGLHTNRNARLGKILYEPCNRKKA